MLLLLWRAGCPHRWSLARSGLPARTRFVAFFVLRDISLCSLSRDSAAQLHRLESMYSSRRRGSDLRFWAARTAWLVFLGRKSVAGELAPPPLYTSQIDTMRVLSFAYSAPRLSAIRVLTVGRRGLQFCFRRCVRDSLRFFRVFRSLALMLAMCSCSQTHTAQQDTILIRASTTFRASER